jgi:hypothetical protein
MVFLPMAREAIGPHHPATPLQMTGVLGEHTNHHLALPPGPQTNESNTHLFV